jgi:hypothetical protein
MGAALTEYESAERQRSRHAATSRLDSLDAPRTIPCMDITADDLWPLVAKLPRAERLRLARLALARTTGPASDADAYARVPVARDEFLDEAEDPLNWDADGWDDVA